MSVAPYRWLVCLGAGATGEVWGAERDGVRLAVKVMLDTHAGSPHWEAIQREMALGPLIASHPGIVAVRRVQTCDGVLHLEMDWVRGPSLAQLMDGRAAAGRPGVPVDVALLWMESVLDALHWACTQVAPHEPSAFVHRDIKPANLMLDPDSGRVRVTDFGMARAAAQMGFQTTETGIVKGTPRFMSPEVLVERDVQRAADQFSVGAVLYELISGLPLYSGANLAEVLTAAMKADVSDQLDALGASVGLRALLARLLARQPGDRYPDHAAAATAIRALRPDPAVLVRELPGLLADADGPILPSGQAQQGPRLRPMMAVAPRDSTMPLLDLDATGLAVMPDDEATVVMKALPTINLDDASEFTDPRVAPPVGLAPLVGVDDESSVTMLSPASFLPGGSAPLPAPESYSGFLPAPTRPRLRAAAPDQTLLWLAFGLIPVIALGLIGAVVLALGFGALWWAA